jgi:hypothetical protein
MADMDDLDTWIANQDKQTAAQANVAISSAGQTPDETAKDFNTAHEFAKVTGNPLPPIPMVKDNRSDFQKAIDSTNQFNVLAASPRLSSWLTNPDNTDVSNITADDLANLSWYEKAGNDAAEVAKGIPGGAVSGTGNVMEGVGRLGASLPTDDQRHGQFDMGRFGSEKDGPAKPQELRATPQPTFMQTALSYVQKADDASAVLDPAFRDVFAGLQSAGESLASAGNSVLPAGEGYEGSWEHALGHTLGALAPIIAASWFGGGAGGLATGVAETGGGGAEAAREAGADEHTQNEAAALSAPFGALDLGPVARLLAKPVVREGIGALVGEVAKQAAVQAGTGAIQTVAQNVIAQHLYQPDRSAFDGLLQSAGVGGLTGVITDLAKLGIEAILKRPIVTAQGQIQQAEGSRATLADIGAQAAASATRARSPDVFNDIVQNGLDGSPISDIYVPADKFTEYFQSKGMDPNEVANSVRGVGSDDLDTALASGGDLRIPTAAYASHFADDPAHNEFFLDNSRFDPSDMTAAEAREFNEHAEEFRQQAFDEAENEREADEASRSTEQKIFDDMVSRLRVAGRPNDVAVTEASLYPAAYATIAKRNNMTTDELLQRYPLPEVAGEIPQGMQVKNVDDLNRTLAEARKNKDVKETRQSLLEFIDQHGGIDDRGGEIKAMDAATIRQGRGKKTLRIARKVEKGTPDMLAAGPSDGKKYGPDDVAQAAIEAGFMSDDPDVIEYKAAVHEGRQVPDITRPLYEAIRREVSGEKQFAEPQGEDAARAEHLASLEQYLSEHGVSLSNSDDEIRQALETRQYAQNNLGSVSFAQDGRSIIRLFQGADLSTLLHESGHFFLHMMQDMAEKGEANSAAEMDVLKGWWKDNAKAVAADGLKAMPDAGITEADVHAVMDGGTTGDMIKDAAVDVGMQEQFARAFEAYLMEGKSPSVGLRDIFAKVASWLTFVYKNLTGLNVKVSPEVKGVFDRLLATDDEIAQAQTDTGMTGPIFTTAEAMGLTPEQYAAFLKVRQQSENEAKAKLLAEMMRPIKRAQDKAYREAKKKVTETVTNEVNKMPTYRAIEWLANGRFFNEEGAMPVDPLKLNKQALIDRYGEGILDTLPRGKSKVYSAEGGHDPDDLAGLFGFDSGDEMVRAMERAPDRKQAIADETDLRMRQEHGDPLTDGSAADAALEAVHNDKKGSWLAAELKAIVEIAGTGDKVMTAKQAAASAKATVGKLRVRDATDSRRYLAAERRAAQEAAKLGAQVAREKLWVDAARRKIETTARAASKGKASSDQVAAAIDEHNAKFETTQSTFNVGEQTRTSASGKEFTIPGGERTTTSHGYNDLVAKLIDAKRRQLVNHALYSESIKASKEVERAETLVKRLNSKTTRAQIAGAGRRENASIDYMSAIDSILDQYDFVNLGPAALARRASLNDFVSSMIAAGRENELAIPAAVLARAVKAPYRTIPMDELRGATDSLRNLEHMAKRWNELIDARNERNFQDTLEKITAKAKDNLPNNPAPRFGKKGSIAKAGKQFLNMILNATTLLRDMDGGEDRGDVYKAIKAPLDEAQIRLVGRNEKTRAALEKIFDRYTKKERRDMAVRREVPGFPHAITTWEKIAIALNTGNADNYQRLTDPNPNLRKSGGSFTPEQVKAVLDSLTPKDAAFVQDVFDHLDSNRADIAARERRVTGIEPKWVEPQATTIGGKEIKGGYYPLKYDAEQSSLTADIEDRDLADLLKGGQFGKAQTRNGHLKARAGSSGQALDLDIAVLARHVNQVNYDLELSEPVTNAWRLVQGMRSTLANAGRSHDFDTLQAWLKDVGTGEVRAADALSRTSRMIKNNYTASKLAFNVATAVGQVAGFAQSMVIVGKRYFALGAIDMLRPGMREQIMAKSPYMAKRAGLFNKDINDFFEKSDYSKAASTVKEIRTAFGKAGFWMMEKLQYYAVDAPTWLAGYRQGMEKFGNNEAEAIAHADDVVKRAQGSGLTLDKSAIERGTLSKRIVQNDFVRLFTALGSYMFTKGNIAYEQLRKAGRNIDADGGGALAWGKHGVSAAMDMVMLFTVDAVVMAAIRGATPSIFGSSNQGDDKKDGWAAFLAKQTAFSAMATLPIVRDFADGLQGFDGGGAYGSAMSTGAKGLIGAYNLLASPVSDRGFKTSDVGAVINATGLATGLPTAQVGRTVNAALRQFNDGKDVSPIEYLLGKRG